MSFNVYLGDIDQNNELGAVLDFRTSVLFRLLFWDSIVLSDSQANTDARLIQLMDGFDPRDAKVALDETVKEQHRGFEALFKNGLIEVAHRSSDGNVKSIGDVWKKMDDDNKKDGHAAVPRLPKNIKYADYLDKMSHSQRVYDLSRISDRFYNNLQLGIGKTVKLNKNHSVDKEYLRIIGTKPVLFRDILDFLVKQKDAGRITQKRYDELYNYAYSCYSTNVSAETDCFVLSPFNVLPLHLSSGFEEAIGNDTPIDENKIRPSWALDPVAVSLLSTDGFLRVRERVKAHIQNGAIMKRNTGILMPEDVNLFYDVWADYTDVLEQAIKEELAATSRRLTEMKNIKYVTERDRLTQLGAEIVKSTVTGAIGAVPVVGNIIQTATDVIQTGREIANIYTLHRSRKKEFDDERYLDAINNYMCESFVGLRTIVTKYQNR